MTANRSFDDAEPLADADGLSSAEQEAWARMQAETPMPTKDEGGDPHEPEKSETPPKQEAKDEDGDEDEDITLDATGRARNSKGEFVETVSKSALLRVKEQRKADRDALDQQRQENARLLGRMQILTDVINSSGDRKAPEQQPKSDDPWAEEVITDPNNPNFDLVKLLGQVVRRQEHDRKQAQTMHQGMQQREQVTGAVRDYVADAKRLAAEHTKAGDVVEIDGQKVPAFQAAYLHLVDQRHSVLEALGMSDKNERNQRIAQEEHDLVMQAIAAKRSPAEALYAVAKASGWRMPAKAAEPSGKSAAQSAAEQKIDRINRNMAQTQSFGGKGGQAGKGLSAAQIINMSDADFDAFTAGLSEEQLNRMLGAE
jgi:hypothetical protein